MHGNFDGQNITERKRRDEPSRMVRYDTLCYVIGNEKLLMLKKSVGLFGGGKWNGLGGKILTGESAEQACVREVYEESGLRVGDIKCHGVLGFWFGKSKEPTITCYVFSTKSFEGQLREGQEGILRWIDFDEIPYDEMWKDDRYWLPLLLKGKDFTGEFHFNQDGTKLLKHHLKPSRL